MYAYGIKKVATTFLCVYVFVLGTVSARAGLSTAFDAKRLTEQSEYVCKVRISSRKHRGTYEVRRFTPPLKAEKITADAEVLSVIKGTLSNSIRIVYPDSTSWVEFTTLTNREIAIVFLQRFGRKYTFTDVDNGKAACVSSAVPYAYGEKPEEKLLSEFIATSAQGETADRLRATTYLGQIGDIRASESLRALSHSSDPAFRGVSLVSRIEVGDSVAPDELLKFLSVDPNTLSSSDSYERYQSSDYSIDHLSSSIFAALYRSVEVDDWHNSATEAPPTSVLVGFDYVGFFEKASSLPGVVDNSWMLESMLNTLRSLADPRSTSLVKRYLDYPDSGIRYLAATALTRIHKHGPFPDMPQFEADEKAYLDYWSKTLSTEE